MLHLVTAFVLIASAPPPCCQRSNAFAQAVDQTATSHRIGHVISPTIVTATFYGTALYFGADRKRARWIAAGLSLAAIVGKELYDHNTAAHNFSSEDIILGTVGTAAGLWIAESIKWGSDEEHRSGKPFRKTVQEKRSRKP